VGQERCSKKKSSRKIWEGKSEKRWNLMCSVALSFIGTVGNRVMIRSPRKRSLSVSTTHVIRTQDQGSERFGSLKYFEIRGVLEKEPMSNGRRSYQSDRHNHLLEVSIKFWRRWPIVLSVTVPDQHTSEPSV
jgi:hypothetical protein